MRRNNGFSLLELLIVVAIILIIATIAIPSLLRSRQTANQTHAVANLRTLNTSQVSYASTHPGIFGSIPDLITAGLLDGSYAVGSGGYDFAITLSADSSDYTASAIARGPNDGRFDYYTRPDYVVRFSTDPARAPTGLSGEPAR